MRTSLIAGNWKMNGRLDDARGLAAAVTRGVAALDGVETVVCPPFLHLESVREALGDTVALGAQNCADAPDGARTGEVSAAMLGDLGARYVILGHSERRQYDGDDEASIAARYAQALAQGLRPILCVARRDGARGRPHRDGGGQPAQRRHRPAGRAHRAGRRGDRL